MMDANELHALTEDTPSRKGHLCDDNKENALPIVHEKYCKSIIKEEDSPIWDLNADMWSLLPEPLLEAILAWLPLPSLFLFRTIAKHWNTIIHSPSFLAVCARVPAQRQAWLLFRGMGKECAAFDPALNKWHHIPLEFLPAQRVVASAGGLLCTRQRDDQLFVCNPLTKAWTEIPKKLRKWRYPIVGMVMDEAGSGYKLVVAGSNSASCKFLTTEVYDSSTKIWKLIATQPLQYQFQTNAVYFEGSFYTAGVDVILAYNIEQEQWTEVAGPVMEHTNLMLPQICTCRDCLLMVEVVTERFLITDVSIWELREPPNGLWIKITSMPTHLLQEITALSGNRLFTYFGHNDIVLFTFARQRVLAYSMESREWTWLPYCPFVHRFARRFANFSYNPRLCATA